MPDALFQNAVCPLPRAFDQAATGKGLSDAAIARQLLVQDVVKRDSWRKTAGTDDLEASKVLKNNKDGIKFPMPILADPKQEIFKLYRAYDDFEGQPLHGTILIDPQGNVRFQRVSADPFLDVEFIKGEAERLNRIVGKKSH